ncbi:hypothetical protein C8Q79DRAFT_1117714 [Trametes meyenii]|nr:hypothetical protein C8Q79DRAFT_1117714 [Trametes meyenii]
MRPRRASSARLTTAYMGSSSEQKVRPRTTLHLHMTMRIASNVPACSPPGRGMRTTFRACASCMTSTRGGRWPVASPRRTRTSPHWRSRLSCSQGTPDSDGATLYGSRPVEGVRVVAAASVSTYSSSSFCSGLVRVTSDVHAAVWGPSFHLK